MSTAVMSAAAMGTTLTPAAASYRTTPALRRSAWRTCRMYLRLLGACVLALAACLTAHAAGQSDPGWQPLFDGKTLDGWRASEAPGSFQVRGGAIVVRGPRSHLYYLGAVADHDFRDFELQLEVMTKPGANSGVYFHTAWQDEGWPAKGYEVQVNNSQSDPKRTGGLYAVEDNFQAPAKDDVWFTLRIRVEGRRIRTYVDDKLIADYTQPERPERPANMSGRVLSSGTFALQAHDPDSEVHYRNIKVRTLP
jgi:hypothetical protein